MAGWPTRSSDRDARYWRCYCWSAHRPFACLFGGQPVLVRYSFTRVPFSLLPAPGVLTSGGFEVMERRQLSWGSEEKLQEMV